MSIELLGLLAACLTTLAFVPQVLKVLKDGDTRGISLVMYTIFCLGVLLWLVYGLLIGNDPIILANALTLLLASTVLYMAWRNWLRQRH